MYLIKHTTEEILDNKIFIGLHNCNRHHRRQIIQDLRRCLQFHRHHQPFHLTLTNHLPDHAAVRLFPLKHLHLPINPVISIPAGKHFPRNTLI